MSYYHSPSTLAITELNSYTKKRCCYKDTRLVLSEDAAVSVKISYESAVEKCLYFLPVHGRSWVRGVAFLRTVNESGNLTFPMVNVWTLLDYSQTSPGLSGIGGLD